MPPICSHSEHLKLYDVCQQGCCPEQSKVQAPLAGKLCIKIMRRPGSSIRPLTRPLSDRALLLLAHPILQHGNSEDMWALQQLGARAKLFCSASSLAGRCSAQEMSRRRL